MFNFAEIAFILVLALILIGPKQLPEVARSIARLINEVKRATESVTADLRQPLPKKNERANPKPSSSDNGKNDTNV